MRSAHQDRFANAEDAESAFYRAFESRDIAIMGVVWSRQEDVMCIHPMGHPIRGWPAIEQSWRMIFEGLGEARFSLSDLKVYDGDGVSVRFVHENIHHGPGYTGISRVLATNVFRDEGEGWRLVSHHASPGGVLKAPNDRAGDRATH